MGVATEETTISRMTAVKVDRIYHADRQALLGDDQGDLTAGHHANADLERVGPVEAADLGSTAAADNFVSRATMTKQTQNSRISGVRPLTSVFRPMLAKNTGAKIT